MLTGTLPYSTPSPADLDRLMKGELVSSPRLRNPKVPSGIADIVMRALAPDPTVRYSRPSEVLEDVIAARETVRRPGRVAGAGRMEAGRDDSVADIQSRLRARDTPQPRFCWHCRKPLQARTAKCPFCGETQ